MLPLYILVLLIHTAFSSIPCLGEKDIVSKETKNPGDLIGAWHYVYHWDVAVNFTRDEDVFNFTICPDVTIDAATPDFVEVKKAACKSKKKDLRAPFKWSDVTLRISSRLMGIKDGVIAIGKEATWFMPECLPIIHIVVKKVFDDYIVLVDPHNTELLAKQVPTKDELKCIAKNLDVGISMKGYGVCFNAGTEIHGKHDENMTSDTDGTIPMI